MLLTVADVTADGLYVPVLEAVGFELRVREPDHRMLRTRMRDVHLHVYKPDRAEVRDYLDLRDWLRVDAADRELYATTKRRLAQQSWRDMNDYAEAKSEVIRDILGRARGWRAGTRSAGAGPPMRSSERPLGEQPDGVSPHLGGGVAGLDPQTGLPGQIDHPIHGPGREGAVPARPVGNLLAVLVRATGQGQRRPTARTQHSVQLGKRIGQISCRHV